MKMWAADRRDLGVDVEFERRALHWRKCLEFTSLKCAGCFCLVFNSGEPSIGVSCWE